MAPIDPATYQLTQADTLPALLPSSQSRRLSDNGMFSQRFHVPVSWMLKADIHTREKLYVG